jgi:nucleotide-binding universal stress UspA family protein
MKSKINILIPTDFSPNSSYACDFTIRQFNHETTHFVIYYSVIPPRSYGGMLMNIADVMLNDAQKKLNQLIVSVKTKFGHQLQIKPVAKVGFLDETIPELIRKEQIDLIAMGTLGESNIISKILGSNTEQVIRKSTIPVLAIPNTPKISDICNVIIATERDKLDDSVLIEKILNSINHQLDVSVLTVFTTEAQKVQKAPKGIELNGRFLPVYVETAPKAMDGIQNYISENEVQLLVMYNLHRTRLDYFFGKSITKKMAGSQRLPLLVVPVDKTE